MNFHLTFEITGDLDLVADIASIFDRPRDSGLEAKANMISPREQAIQAYLKDKDYGIGLQKFHLVLQLLSPHQALNFPGGQVYRPRKKEVLFGYLLDIQWVLAATEVEWKKRVCFEILKTILRCPELKIKNFDYQAFYDDLKDFFLENGWIPKQEVG